MSLKVFTKPTALVKLDEKLLGSSQPTIQFSAILGTCRALQLDLVGRGDSSGALVGVNGQFNGDTAANYANESVIGQNTVIVAGGGITTTSFSGLSIPGTGQQLLMPGFVRWTIPQYTGTVFYKVVHGTQGYFISYPDAEACSGLWKSTAAITSILLSVATGNFVAGTVASLYGIL